MKGRVVAVVCSFWPNRLGNVQKIIADLQAGTKAPDRILFLNNNPEPLHRDAVDDLLLPGAEVIHAPNTTCRGKFIAGLFDPADYYLLLDDDTSVGPRTLETLMAYAHRGICTGFLGCWLDDEGSVNKGARLWPKDAREETRCLTFCGCAMFMSFSSLIKMLMLEERVRLDGEWPHQGDDILAGLANRSTVIPLADDAAFVDLGTQGQAMCYSDEDYYGMRDRFTKRVLDELHKGPLPEWEV